jgi:hypothetical protein
MENKQTAVEWLIEKLEGDYSKIAMLIGLKEYNSIIKQAIAMEKEQEFKTKAYWFGRGILAAMEGKIGELKPTKDGE